MGRFKAYMAAILGSLFLRKKQRPQPQHLQRMEFGCSCQKMGFRFTERIRNVWRRRWVRLKK